MADDLNAYAPAYTEISEYGWESRMTFTWYADRVIDLSPSGDMLELGIGYGDTSAKFGTVYRKHRIIEGSPGVIEHFRRTHPGSGSEIVRALFEEYDEDDSFDVIVMGFILEHVDDPDLILKRYRRYLRPHGSLYVTVPNALSLHRRIGHASGLLPDLYQMNDYDRKAGHKRYYDVEMLRRSLEHAGYSIRKMEGLFLKPVTTSQLDSLHLPREVLLGMFRIGVEYPELSNAVFVQAQIS